MLPLLPVLAALVLPGSARAAEMETTLLVCREGDGCEEERQWLAGVQPGLILVADGVQSLDDFVPTDGATTFATAVEAADYAVQDKRWKTAEAHLDRAAAALEAWPGSVENHLLVRMYTLRGVALRRQGKDGVEAAFRQAGAMAWSSEPDPRGLDADDQLALDTERRKLLASGVGRLEITGNASLWLDGVPIERRLVDLPAGLHRLTAVEPGRLRTFVANVPVLPDRTVTVRPEWGPTDDTAWLLAQLGQGIERLDADPQALALLSDWCARHEVDRLAVAEVVPAVMAGIATQITTSDADPLRPAAAAGEAIPQELGIPATFEATVQEAAEFAAEPARPVTSWRLRVAYFDAGSRRLSSEPAPIRVADTVDARRFHLAARVGWWHHLDREHATLDARAHWSLRDGFGVRGEVGAVLADAPYNFYADWVDSTLLHAAVAGTWSGPANVAPTFAAGVELEAPLWVGAFGEAGVVARFDRVWVADLVARVGVGAADGGIAPAWGGGFSLGRRW